jgi:glycosyltransferase involved in cell wall biosynthesis
LNLSEQVDFLGACSHEEVANTMQTVRAFVQHSVTTSYGDSEGTPVAVLEAAASGLPVIATRHAGIKDVVVENCTGLLVEEGDVIGMSQQMVKIAEEPDLASHLGKQARKKIQVNFSINASIEKLGQIIFNTIPKW